MVLIIGPVITNIGVSDVHGHRTSPSGIVIQLIGVVNSACKYVFAHSVMQACKKDLGSFAFLFWLDFATLFILIPWSFIDGSMVQLYGSLHSAGDVGKLILTSILGGLRFFTQLLVLRFTTATNLSCANICFQAINIYLSLAIFPDATKVTAQLICGTVLTLLTSAVYTYWKVSKILTKAPYCIRLDDNFQRLVRCQEGRTPVDPVASASYSKA